MTAGGRSEPPDRPLPAPPRLARDEEDAAGRSLARLTRRLLVPLALALLVIVGLALFADARELARSLGEFDYRILAPVLGLSLLNYGLRFWRWQVYLNALDVRLRWRDSLAVFLSGFVLSVTPGKAGELGKAWLARELGGGAARRTVAVVLAERLGDLLGMALLLAVGALRLPGGRWIAAGGVLACGLAVVLLTWEPGARTVLGGLSRLPGLGPRLGVLEEVWEHLQRLLLPGPLLAVGLGASVLAWGAEGVGFALVLRDFAPQAGWLTGVFDYCLSTLVGALSMLPGGLLAAEGSLTAILGLEGLAPAASASATLLIRAATLWFAVVLGLAAIPWVWRRLREEGFDK